MKTVSKLIMIDLQNNYLMMWRSEHPTFGIDPDLPGGTLEEGESLLEAMLREVKEEIGITIDGSLTKELYNGTDYSKHGTRYVLYAVKLDIRPEVVMSWEHSSYEWLPRDEFIEKAKNAKDTYMHMVGDVVAARADM